MMNAHRLRLLIVLSLGSIVATGCDRDPITALPFDPDVDLAELVTPRTAPLIDRDGRFLREEIVQPAGEGEIRADRALELATAYLSQFGSYLRSSFELQRGASVDVDGLRPTGETLYARTLYGTLPDGIHPGAVKAFGSYYLVPFEDRLGVAVVVAVSSGSGNLDLAPDGRILFPKRSGSEFFAAAVPVGLRGLLPLRPETAARAAALAAGVRVDGLPKMILPPRRIAPQHAYWRVELEQEIEISLLTGEKLRRVKQLYLRTRWKTKDDLYQPVVTVYVAAPVQPSVLSVLVPTTEREERRGRSSPRLMEIDIPVRGGADPLKEEWTRVSLGGGR